MSAKEDYKGGADEEEDEDSKYQDVRSAGLSERQADAKDVGDVPQLKLRGQALVLKVQEYFYGDEGLARAFERFISEKSVVMDLDAEEYKLEYTAAYEEYKALFETMIGGYIESLGVTVEDFYQALQAMSAEDEWSNEAIFALILSSVCDFDIFMTMMREGKKGNKVSHK